MSKHDASRRTYFAAWAHGLGAALLPALGAGSLFLPGLPVPGSRVLLVGLSLAGVLLVLAWSSRGRPGAFERRAAAFTLSIIFLVAYPAFATVFRVAPYSTGDAWFGLAFLIGVGAMIVALRFWRRDFRTLSAVLLALVWMSLVLLLSGNWYRYLTATEGSWSIVRARLTAPPHLSASTDDDPNILHVVVDGMGGADILAEYGVRQSDLEALGSSGLHVVPHAVANYPYTYATFASMLNMEYLDELSAPLARRYDPRPYLTLVHQSAVFRALQQRGYEITVIGSGFDVTATAPLSDRCKGCGYGFPSLFETALASILPVRSLISWSTFYDAHRRRLTGALDALATTDFGTRQAQFVMAHVMAPHPPFVLGADGPVPGPDRPFEILDMHLFRGTREEYRRGYAGQATYVLHEVLRIAEQARQRSRRPLVVIIHGDHGPGLDFDATSLSPRGLRERFSILLAIAWPEGTPVVVPRSPVNIYRAVLTAFHGAKLQPLPDRGFVPERDAPFKFMEIDLHSTASSP